MNRCQSFPIRFWVDLHRVCNHLNWITFHSGITKASFVGHETRRAFPFDNSGYISPGAMVTGLSALTHLERLCLELESPISRPSRQSQRFPTRCVLPALTRFKYHGSSAFLDDFVAHIYAPRLDDFSITFFDLRDVDTSTPHLIQFISRTPNSKAFGKAHIIFYIGRAVMINLSRHTFGPGELNLATVMRNPRISNVVFDTGLYLVFAFASLFGGPLYPRGTVYGLARFH